MWVYHSWPHVGSKRCLGVEGLPSDPAITTQGVSSPPDSLAGVEAETHRGVISISGSYGASPGN